MSWLQCGTRFYIFYVHMQFCTAFYHPLFISGSFYPSYILFVYDSIPTLYLGSYKRAFIHFQPKIYEISDNLSSIDHHHVSYIFSLYFMLCFIIFRVKNLSKRHSTLREGDNMKRVGNNSFWRFNLINKKEDTLNLKFSKL